MLDTGQHASAEDLMLYANGALTGEAAEILADHLDRCDDCCLAVMLQRELQDLEALKVLPPADSGALQLPVSAKPAPPRSSKGPGIAGALGGIFTGLGLGDALRHQPIPGLAGDASHDDVRSDPAHASGTGEGHHSEGGQHMGHGISGFSEATHSYGVPASDHTSDYVHQSYPDTCAVQCQHLILDNFGIHVSEDQLVKEAENRGIYAPGHGTRPEDVGKLLEAHGVAIHRELNANVFNLATELAQGHQVIVGLDSGELWHENSILQSIADALGIGHADHAVIVSGIDTTDPHEVKVIVTDPGTGDVAKQYPLHEFLDAWQTSHFSLVATSEPVPAWHPEMVNFDYQAGHLPMVGGAPYEFAHELSAATTHETNIGVMHGLESLFLSVVNGHVSVGSLFDGLVHPGGFEPHGTLHMLVNELLSLEHAGMLTGAITALLDTSESHPETALDSSAPAFEQESHGLSHEDAAGLPHQSDIGHDYDAGHHHDVLHHSNSSDADHHQDDPGDPLDWHHNH